MDGLNAPRRIHDLTRRDLLKMAPATLVAFLAMETGAVSGGRDECVPTDLMSASADLRSMALLGESATAEIAIDGGEYEQSYGEMALQLLKRQGWYRFVANNITSMSFNYKDQHGAELVRNWPTPESTRGLALITPRVAMHPTTIAHLLVHEAVHQCLYNRGIGYRDTPWQYFPYEGRVRPWQLHEYAASLVQQIFIECCGLPDGAYRRPEALL